MEKPLYGNDFILLGRCGKLSRISMNCGKSNDFFHPTPENLRFLSCFSHSILIDFAINLKNLKGKRKKFCYFFPHFYIFFSTKELSSLNLDLKFSYFLGVDNCLHIWCKF